MFTNAKTKKIYYDLIYSNWQDIHLKIIDIFESISLWKDIDYKELARTMKIHIEKEQARVLKEINEAKI